MKKLILVLVVFMVFLLGISVTQAAPSDSTPADKWQTYNVVAAKHANPLDFTFFDNVAPGIVRITSVENIYGPGVRLAFYVKTPTGQDVLTLNFDGPMKEQVVTAKLTFRNITLFAGLVKDLFPMTIFIYDGALSAEAGSGPNKQPRPLLKGFTAWTGNGQTQSINARLMVYDYSDEYPLK
jgi:hypothetical protein